MGSIVNVLKNSDWDNKILLNYRTNNNNKSYYFYSKVIFLLCQEILGICLKIFNKEKCWQRNVGIVWY